MKKNYILLGTALGVVTLTTGAFALNKAFPDLESDHWAYEAVDHFESIGLLEGYSDGTIRPNQPITRAETFTLLDKYDHMIQEMVDKKINEKLGNSMNEVKEESMNMVYENEKYDFGLTLPGTWEDFIVSEREEMISPNYFAIIDFGLAEQKDLFAISVFKKDEWDALQKEEGPKPTYLAEGNGYVYGYSTSQYAANDEMKERRTELDSILKTFELL